MNVHVSILDLVNWLDYSLFPFSVLAVLGSLRLIVRMADQRRAVNDPDAPVPASDTQKATAKFHLQNSYLLFTASLIMTVISSSLFFPLFDVIDDPITRMVVIRIGLDIFVFIVLIKIGLWELYWRHLHSLLLPWFGQERRQEHREPAERLDG